MEALCDTCKWKYDLHDQKGEWCEYVCYMRILWGAPIDPIELDVYKDVEGCHPDCEGYTEKPVAEVVKPIEPEDIEEKEEVIEPEDIEEKEEVIEPEDIEEKEEVIEPEDIEEKEEDYEDEPGITRYEPEVRPPKPCEYIVTAGHKFKEFPSYESACKWAKYISAYGHCSVYEVVWDDYSGRYGWKLKPDCIYINQEYHKPSWIHEFLHYETLKGFYEKL